MTNLGQQVDEFEFWDKHFKVSKDKPAQVYAIIAQLLKEKKYRDVEAAIKSYLRYNSKQAEPWMYEWLIKTIELRKGSDYESEVRQAIGYAASLAKRNKNPNDLIRVADMMVMRNLYGQVGDLKYETNIGELIDIAAEKIPANAIPPMMSVNLAAKTNDPKRMADAAERLLALGWPGFDDKMRSDLKEQVRPLEESLRTEGRNDEAELLVKNVAESEIRDVYISLKWAGEGDLDLVVDEPLGATAKYANPRTVFGGSLIKNGYGKHPEEVYVCPRGFDGDYTVRIDTIYNDDAKPVRDVVMTIITHEGGPNEAKQEKPIDLKKPVPITVKLTGGRRKEVLPFIAPPQAPSLVVKDPKADKPAPTNPNTR